MKRIYSNEVLANVVNLQNVLRLHGIKATIKNQYLDLVGLGGVSDPAELWVEDEDVKRALRILQYETRVR